MNTRRDIAPPVLIAALMTAGLFLSVGCAHTVVVAPKVPGRDAAEEVPIDVGLYLTNEFRNYKVSEFRMGDKFNYDNLGQASATQFTVGLGQLFRTVEVVDERPPFVKPKSRTVHAVVEPAITGFDFVIPVYKVDVYTAKIKYKITVYDLSGHVLFTRLVEGIGYAKGVRGFDFVGAPSQAASKAIEEGINMALELLFSSEEIKGLLKQ